MPAPGEQPGAGSPDKDYSMNFYKWVFVGLVAMPVVLTATMIIVDPVPEPLHAYCTFYAPSDVVTVRFTIDGEQDYWPSGGGLTTDTIYRATMYSCEVRP